MYKRQGFTLIELIIAIFIIGLVAVSVFVSINPSKRMVDAKNSQRWADIIALQKAIEKYTADNGSVPPDFSSSTLEIGQKVVLCDSISELTCDGQTRSCALIDNPDFFGKYLGSLPIDPDKISMADTGYFMTRGAANGLVLGVCDNDVIPEITMTTGARMADLFLNFSLTDTSDTDFASGTVSLAAISGSGSGASIELSQVERLGMTGVNETNQDFAYDSSTNSIWVVRSSDGQVIKVSATTGSVLATYNVGMTPRAIAFDSSTNSIWVANGTSKNIMKINPSTGAILGTYGIGVNAGPLAIAFDSSTNSIWVSSMDASWYPILNKVDVSDGSIISTTTLSSVMYSDVFGLAFDSATNSIWATMYDEDEVKKIDVSNGNILDTYDVGDRPYGLTFDSSTNSIWVANYVGSINKLDASDGVPNITYSPSCPSAKWPIFDSTTNSIWLTCAATNLIKKLLAADGSLTATYDIGVNASHGVFDATSDSIWISDGNGMNVTNISVTDGSIQLPNFVTTYTIIGNTSSYDAVYDPSTDSIWVTNAIMGGGKVTKISASTGSEIDTYNVGSAAMGIEFTSSTNSIWTVNNRADNVTKLRASDGFVEGTYDVGSRPEDAVYDPSTDSIWITNNSGNTVTKLNASTGGLIDTHSVGTAPKGIAFDSSTDSIWVANAGSGNVTKLRASDGFVLGTYPITSPVDLAFDPINNQVWVVGNQRIYQLNAADGNNLGNAMYSLDGGFDYVIFDPVTESIWALIPGYNTFFKINSSREMVVSYSTKDNPAAIVSNPSTNSMWVIKGSSTDEVMEYLLYSYSSSGTFTSQIFDTTINTAFSTIDWTSTLPSNTTITTKVRTDSSSNMSGATAWASCIVVTDGSGISANACVTDTDQYVQYQTTLSTTDTSATPELNDMTINYVQG